MVERGSGGHIVNLASMATAGPQQSFTAYSTSKAVVHVFRTAYAPSWLLRASVQHLSALGLCITSIVANTQFSGVSARTEADKQQKFNRSMRSGTTRPNSIAERIVAAVAKKKSIRAG